MKTLTFLLILPALLALTLTGCKKDKENPILNVSNDDAAGAVAYGLAGSSGGLVAQVEDAAELAATGPESLKGTADYTYDSSFTITNPSGSPITYSYAVNYHYGVVTPHPAGVPYFFLEYDMEGQYHAARVSAAGTNTGSFTLTGLAASSSVYMLNGSAQRSGTVTASLSSNITFTSDINLTLTAISIDKYTYMINSGSGTITVTGTGPNNQAFSFTGTVVFLGNHSVQLTLSGKIYTIDSETGEIK
jgi:hypothetical protein